MTVLLQLLVSFSILIFLADLCLYNIIKLPQCALNTGPDPESSESRVPNPEKLEQLVVWKYRTPFIGYNDMD